MAIEAISITSRLSAYSCCAAGHGYNWVVREALGDPCWEESRRRYRFLSWAMGILSRYPLEDDPCGCDGCVTEDFVNDVIALADPGCVKCACPATFPPVDPCAIVPDYTVLEAIPDTDVPLAADGTYLLTEIGGIETSVIVTVAGGVYSIQFAVPNGYVVYASVTTTFYSAFQTITTLLFPGITVGTVLSPNLFNVISDNAPYAFAQNRDIIIEALDGVDWEPVYTGVEQDIAMSLTVDTTGIVDNPTNFRVKYLVGACQYGPVDATVFNTTPPFTNILFGTDPLFPFANPVTIQKGTFGGAFATTGSFTSLSPDGDVRKVRIAFDDPSKAVAGINTGLLRFSADAGATWSAPAGNWAASPDIPDYAFAEFSSIHNGGGGAFFYAGRGGVLMHSLDYGATVNYLPQTTLLGADVRCVAGLGAATDIVVGTFANGVWRTVDSGTTWTQVLAITDPVLHIEVTGSTVLAFSSVGVWRSADSGVTWPSFPNTAILVVLATPTDSSVIGPDVHVVANNGRFKSTNFGQTWLQQSPDSHLAVKALSAQIILYISADNNIATYSANGGITTTPFAMGAYQYYGWTVDGYIYP